jgi:DNA invertase Pin-like site-specific DNA recombinase
LIRRLRGGDVVIITAVNRLSRDTTDLLVLARQMQQAGAGLRSLAEPLVDTTSEFCDLVLAVLGLAAKLERRRILERTARGRAEAMAKGVRFGRKPKLSPQQREQVVALRLAGEAEAAIGGCSTSAIRPSRGCGRRYLNPYPGESDGIMTPIFR